MKPHCKTCKWWVPDNEASGWTWGTCEMAGQDAALFQVKNDFTTLKTRQTFGCVQHEDKTGVRHV